MKQIIKMEHNKVKNPSCYKANQLAILKAWPRIWARHHQKQIQLTAVRAGLELSASQLQVQHPNCLAMLAPLTKSISTIRIMIKLQHHLWQTLWHLAVLSWVGRDMNNLGSPIVNEQTLMHDLHNNLFGGSQSCQHPVNQSKKIGPAVISVTQSLQVNQWVS